MFLSRSSYDDSYRPDESISDDKKSVSSDPNPDPSKYTILSYFKNNRYLMISIQYEGCTNYEGKKVLVYRDCTIDQLRTQKLIDPHFSENKKYFSPIARFEPTNFGQEMAVHFIGAMIERDQKLRQFESADTNNS